MKPQSSIRQISVRCNKDTLEISSNAEQRIEALKDIEAIVWALSKV